MMDDSSTDINAIKKAFVRLIRDNLFDGEELALLEPVNGPRPPVLYASIQFIAARPLQNEVYDYSYDEADDTITESIRGERYCRFRVTFRGVGANQKAVDCQNLLRSNIGFFGMTPITGFGYVGEIQDATSEYLGTQEERSTFIVELYANLSAQYRAESIETVTGDIVREDAPYPYEVTVIKQ